ncbi:MAG: cation transporter, partial [Clostridia bacterium]|nr:cation transporter [Clostridia bacterium]
MITLLSKIFIKDNKNYSDASVRSSYGVLCGAVGILLNVFLFAIKFFAGIISKSVAVTADAFNNLSDAGSSVIALFGFKLASQKPDKDHPFGHGRFEYISGLFVSAAIIIMGVELVKTSFDKIINPETLTITPIAFIILIISVAVKFYMSVYNKNIGRKIRSSAMEAISADSLSDMLATSVVIISMLVSRFTSFQIDGYCGMAVAFFIIFAGFRSAKETISPLLGQVPDKEFVSDIEKTVMSYPEIVGIHDLIVHDYGPGRVMISLHAEVDENSNLLEIHDVIDNVEKHLSEKFGCNTVIHMDPVSTSDDTVKRLKNLMNDFAKSEFGESSSIHDFRIV